MTDEAIKAALTEADVVRLTIYGEARGEPIEGQVAVGSVIRNRVLTRRFGRDYRAVCLRRLQFSCWWPQGGAANYRVILDLARQLVEGHQLSAGPQWLQCGWVAEGIRSNALLDNARGATHYHTTTVSPAWATGQTPVVRYRDHLFFRGIA